MEIGAANSADARRNRAEYMRAYMAQPEQRERARLRYLEKAKSPEYMEAARARAAAWQKNNRDRAKAANAVRYAAKPKKGRMKNETHHKWKGDGVGYFALHTWVKRQKGSPSKCEHCGTESAKRFEWANVDHKYQRVLADYIRLCTSCHRRYDYANGLCEKGGPRGPRLKAA